MRRFFAVFVVLAIAIAGYATADAYDRVPGILTIQKDTPDTLPDQVVGADAELVSLPQLVASKPLLKLPTSKSGVTTADGISGLVSSLQADPALGPGVTVVVRRTLADDTLTSIKASAPRVPASLQKLISAAGVADALDVTSAMTTSVVRGKGDEIVLIAGGDTMLARGSGDPTATVGRAGLGDLAKQVAKSLGATKTVSLRLDLSYAAGPTWPKSWERRYLGQGISQTIQMIGLGDQRPDSLKSKSSPADPPASVANAFVDALKKEGITASLTKRGGWDKPAPAEAAQLGAVQSASVAEVLGQALEDSDNALMENLARQASVAAGVGPSLDDVVSHTKDVLEAYGLDTSGMALKDASGLSPGQKVRPELIADVLDLSMRNAAALAKSATTPTSSSPAPTATPVAAPLVPADDSYLKAPKHKKGPKERIPGLDMVMTNLAIAGLAGTLDHEHKRFISRASQPAAGIARAKTGTLTSVSGLAGLTTTADGDLLTFVVLSNAVPGGGTDQARAAQDVFTAGLTQCGCATASSAKPGASKPTKPTKPSADPTKPAVPTNKPLPSPDKVKTKDTP